MPRGSATNDLNLAELLPLLWSELEVIKKYFAGFFEHTAVEGFLHGPALLVNFLEHVVPEAFLLGRHRIPENFLRLAFDWIPGFVEDLDRLLFDDRVVAVFEIDDVPGVAEKRGDVGCDDVFILANPDDQRRTVTCSDDLSRIVARDHDQGVVTVDLGEHLPDRLDKSCAVEVRLDEMRHDLGVSLGLEGVTFGDELLLE